MKQTTPHSFLGSHGHADGIIRSSTYAAIMLINYPIWRNVASSVNIVHFRLCSPSSMQSKTNVAAPNIYCLVDNLLKKLQVQNCVKLNALSTWRFVVVGSIRTAYSFNIFF